MGGYVCVHSMCVYRMRACYAPLLFFFVPLLNPAASPVCLGTCAGADRWPGMLRPSLQSGGCRLVPVGCAGPFRLSPNREDGQGR